MKRDIENFKWVFQIEDDVGIGKSTCVQRIAINKELSNCKTTVLIRLVLGKEKVKIKVTSRGVNKRTHIYFSMVYRLILLSLIYISMKQKEYFHFESILTLHISPQFFPFSGLFLLFLCEWQLSLKKLLKLGGDTRKRIIVFVDFLLEWHI